VEAFFLSGAEGDRFCLLHMPPVGQAVRGGLLFIPPLAEELNRSRRMVALQARAFAQAGYAVLQLDLHGCGDSAGEFADASWASWVRDVVLARQCLAERLPGSPDAVWLWGLRAGCLLAAELARLPGNGANPLLLWQPVLSGQQHLNQFLRLKMVANMVQGRRGDGTDAMAQRLANGHPVEVAGYALSAALAQGLAGADLEGLGTAPRIACFEMAGLAGDGVSPALNAQWLRWQAAGSRVSIERLAGPLFWQTEESGACPALVEASLAVVLECAP
jgi:exosortase A-associated hydrolase 2